VAVSARASISAEPFQLPIIKGFAPVRDCIARRVITIELLLTVPLWGLSEAGPWYDSRNGHD